MTKMTYRDYRDLIENPDTPDEEIEKCSLVVKGAGAFDFQIIPNPDMVLMTPDQMELENAMAAANGIARWRRQQKFKKRVKKGEQLPIIVSEGDSWYQFPILIKDVVDQLKNDYLIYSVGAAGDTAQNMVFGPEDSKKTEYMRALRKMKDDGLTVSGFMFSAAGNDVIGENPNTGIAALQDILRDFNGNTSDVMGHINLTEFVQRLNFLQTAYLKVISSIRSEPGFARLPIFIHGYDYVFPHPWVNDNRKPVHAKKDEWLGEPLEARGIMDNTLRREIIKTLLDMVYDMLGQIAGDPQHSGVWLVDCRGAMPDVSDWCDEIHGTNDGFAKVAARFRSVMAAAI